MRPVLFNQIRPVFVSVPPVTGVNGNNLPYANSFDASRTFRDRAGSGVKRARRDGQDDLLNSVYDLTRDFPAPTFPDRPTLDVAAIKAVLVEATAAAENVKPLLEQENVPEEVKTLAKSNIALTALISCLVEKGVEPMAGLVTGVGGGQHGRNYAAAARRMTNPPPPTPKPMVPGKKELIDALEKSEKEAVLFGANLGASVVANRNTLNNNLTVDIQRRTLDRTAGKPDETVRESLRLVEDALTCVENIEFIGQRSKPITNSRETADGSFCTMPVKLNFADRDSRINFERTVRENVGLRVVQSLPQAIRKEMAAFRKALEERYPEEIVMTRPNSASLEFVAFRKRDGDKRWTSCTETHPIPLGIMLPGFKESTRVSLPMLVEDSPDVMLEDATGGGGGGEVESPTRGGGE